MSKRWWKRQRNQVIVAAAACAALIAGFAVILSARPATPPHTSIHEAIQPSVNKLPRLVAPAGTKTLVVGDSWALGYSAKPDTDGFVYQVAQQFGWQLDMKAVSGTGYVKPGPTNSGTYIQRLYEMPVDPNRTLVILQGSLNDVSGRFRVAKPAMSTLADVHYRFPRAQVIVIGPGTDVMPIPSESRMVSADLQWAAAKNRAYFIAINDAFTRKNFETLIDPVTHHPNNAGHDYLAKMVGTAVTSLMSQGQVLD